MSDAIITTRGSRLIGLVVLTISLGSAACERAEPVQLNEYGNPLKMDARPTSADISVEDLQTRLYVFADDSMMGRQSGREGNMKGTAYIAREIERLGLEPAGIDGTYFQPLPYIVRRYTANSTLSVDGQALGWLTDYIATPGNAPPRPISEVQVVFGGVAGDTVKAITAAQAAGNLVVLLPPAPGQRGRGGFGGGRGAGEENEPGKEA